MTQDATVRRLLAGGDQSFAAEAGITLRDKPSPLYQLLVLTTLASTRISAEIAAAAARELFAAGWRTPERMRASTWQQRVDALGRGGYRRYDESTATTLDESAAHLQQEHRGDLRRIRPRSRDGVRALQDALQGFPRIGPTGADIFCREVQGVWPEVSPFFDKRAIRGARELDLPTDPDRLARLAPRGRVGDLAAALARSA